MRARILGEDEHAVADVDERRLLGDEVQAVVDGVHEQHVELLVRGDRALEVVRDPKLDGGRVSRVHVRGRSLDRRHVLDVLGNRLPRRIEQRVEPRPAAPLGIGVEQHAERFEAAHDVLRRVGSIDPEDKLLRPRRRDLLLLGEHAR